VLCVVCCSFKQKMIWLLKVSCLHYI